MFDRIRNIGKSKEDRQFELLDGRLIGIQSQICILERVLARKSDLRETINDLTKSIKEISMGLKEDFETLSARFDAMDSATQAVADDIAALKEEIRTLNESSNVDLTGLIARADNIEARLRGAAGPNAGSDPETGTDGVVTGDSATP